MEPKATAAQRGELEKMLERATPGPWRIGEETLRIGASRGKSAQEVLDELRARSLAALDAGGGGGM